MNKMSKLMVGLLLGVMLLVASVGSVAAAGGPPEDRGMGVGQGTYGTGMVAGTALTDAQVAALTDFWLDEYHALHTYEAIMDDFGTVAPFASIANAEEMHIASLERAFDRYGIELPAVPAGIDVDFETVEDACTAAAQAEIDNANLYAELEAIFTQTDLLRVFEQLSSASLNNHLPAFEACADGDYEPVADGDMVQYQYGNSSTGTVRGNMNADRPYDQGAYRTPQGDQDCTSEPVQRWNGRSR